MSRPLVIELFCGMFGWSAGCLEMGWQAVGFDIEHKSYHGPVPAGAELVLQDVRTLHGSQFRDASLILASPPCQEFSYQAMPWKRAKQIAAALRGQGAFPDGYTGSRTVSELTALFDTCFRIQREASEAAGRYIPLVVENVKGAQPWVGRANAAFGSFFLWGDVRSVGGRIVAAHRVRFGGDSARAYRSQKHNPDGTQHGTGSWFAVADSKNRGARKPDALTEEYNGHDDPRRGRETTNGSWFAMGANGKSNLAPDGRKVPMNFHEHEKTGKPGRSFQSAAVKSSGVKRMSGLHGLSARKAASAQIAKIPFELASYIARSFRPQKKRIA